MTAVVIMETLADIGCVAHIGSIGKGYAAKEIDMVGQGEIGRHQEIVGKMVA